jgi:hypothetical protein
MRRPSASLPLLALGGLLAAAAPADAAIGKFFPGEVADPSPVVKVEDVDVARDGHGAIVALRPDGLVLVRHVNGGLAAPERGDGGLPGATQGAVAVSDGGRIVVAFATPGGVFAMVKPAGGGFGAPQQLAPSGSDPDVSMSVGGHAYVVWRTGGDVRAARMDRRELSFTGLPEPLDVDPARDAGANGRPRVSTSADGSAIAVWGEGGTVVARRLYGLTVSRAPQELAPEGSDPDVEIQDDSSWAWAVYRTPGGAVARRQRGSAFDDPVPLGATIDAPRLAMSGRGDGYAVTGAGGGALASVLKDHKFHPARVLGATAGGGRPVATAAEGGDGIVAWFGPGGSVQGRAFDNNPRSRLATVPDPEVTITDPTLGAADPEGGLEAAGNRAGDALVAWVQVDSSGARRLVAGTFDRWPGAFRGTTGTNWRKARRPELRWAEAFELWGPVTYSVFVDGVQVGQTTGRSLVPSVDIPDDLRRWQVVATDRRGQVQRSLSRNLRVDATPPTLTVTVKRRKGGRVEITPKVSDDPGTGQKASGVAFVRVDAGRSTVTLVKPPYKVVRMMKKGAVRVSATDRAGNAVSVSRTVR